MYVFVLAKPITKNPVVRDIYGIKSSIDGSFNRGFVEEILNKNQYSVFFIDLGIRDIVSINSFVEVSEQLKLVIFVFIIIYYNHNNKHFEFD